MSRLVDLYIRERVPVSRAGPASRASSPPRRAAIQRSKRWSRWQALQAPERHPPKVRGPAAPGSYLVAPPKPGRVRLLRGWPAG